VSDLFQSDGPERIPLPDADLRLFHHFDLGVDPGDLMQALLTQVHWRSEQIQVYGKTYLQPRLLAWYGDAEARYTYSGISHQPLPWLSELSALRQRLTDVIGSPFNSVLLNYYRDGSDSMGLHADDEPELGPEPVIASVSLGATRTLYFRHRQRRELETLNLPLAHGSLLVMAGATQRHWKHGIRKIARPCGPRINLTFRQVSPRS
jgi:alkylated DNA repair dioxygenase AlkB